MSVGVGVIGTGVMGSEHARLLNRETPHAHLAGVFDANAARAQAAAGLTQELPQAVGVLAQEQPFPAAPGRRPAAHEPGREHTRVVQHE